MVRDGGTLRLCDVEMMEILREGIPTKAANEMELFCVFHPRDYR